MGLTMKEKFKVIAETASRYQKACKKNKEQILSKLVAVNGYNRTYAMHLLMWWGKQSTGLSMAFLSF
jgi:hypothetical protein